MVLAIPVWYLHPPEMVPQPSLPPHMQGIPMTIPILTPTIPSTPPLTNPPTTARSRRKKKEPTAPPPHVSNLLARYVRKMHTQPTNAHLYLSYVT
jgi:hypothetical protein